MHPPLLIILFEVEVKIKVIFRNVFWNHELFHATAVFFS